MGGREDRWQRHGRTYSQKTGQQGLMQSCPQQPCQQCDVQQPSAPFRASLLLLKHTESCSLTCQRCFYYQNSTKVCSFQKGKASFYDFKTLSKPSIQKPKRCQYCRFLMKIVFTYEVKLYKDLLLNHHLQGKYASSQQQSLLLPTSKTKPELDKAKDSCSICFSVRNVTCSSRSAISYVLSNLLQILEECIMYNTAHTLLYVYTYTHKTHKTPQILSIPK